MAKSKVAHTLAEIAAGLKTQKAREAAIVKNPRILAHLDKVTAKEIELAFAKGGEWFKEAIFKHPSAAIQVAAVKCDPDLIRWCIIPSKTALKHAIKARPSLAWVANTVK